MHTLWQHWRESMVDLDALLAVLAAWTQNCSVCLPSPAEFAASSFAPALLFLSGQALPDWNRLWHHGTSSTSSWKLLLFETPFASPTCCEEDISQLLDNAPPFFNGLEDHNTEKLLTPLAFSPTYWISQHPNNTKSLLITSFVTLLDTTLKDEQGQTRVEHSASAAVLRFQFCHEALSFS